MVRLLAAVVLVTLGVPTVAQAQRRVDPVLKYNAGLGASVGWTLGEKVDGAHRVHGAIHAFAEVSIPHRQPPAPGSMEDRTVLGPTFTVRIRDTVDLELIARGGVGGYERITRRRPHLTMVRATFGGGLMWRPRERRLNSIFALEGRLLWLQLDHRFRPSEDLRDTLNVGLEAGLVPALFTEVAFTAGDH